MAWLTAAALRVFDEGLANPDVYGEDQLEAVIVDVEAEIERIIGTAYNSRTATDEWHLGDGTEWLRLDFRWPTSVTAASIDGVALSADALTGLVVNRTTGMVRYTAGWTDEADVLVTYAYGKSAPPSDLLRAAKILCRARLGQTRNGIPDRAERWQPDGAGGMFSLAMPSAGRTGVPDVDAILARYVLPGIA